MTNEKAIKYLKQLYPNGGHCWLDEQRIEAIGMAVKALQKEPVSEDLEEAAKLHVTETRGEDIVWDENARCAMLDFKAGANWQLNKIRKENEKNVLRRTEL